MRITLALIVVGVMNWNSAFAGNASRMLAPYLKIQTQLAADSMDGIQKAAKELATATSDPQIKAIAQKMAGDGDLKSVREHFKELSGPMDSWAKANHPKGVDRVRCPMAGANWLQTKGSIRNPYYGREMLTCGDVLTD